MDPKLRTTGLESPPLSCFFLQFYNQVFVSFFIYPTPPPTLCESMIMFNIFFRLRLTAEVRKSVDGR